MILVYCKGRVKVYFPNGAQSPRLDPAELRDWLDLGGEWTRHANERR